MKEIYVVEPFYGGSHKQLLEFLLESCFVGERPAPLIRLHTLPAKKWHWRARTSALHFAENIPEIGSTDYSGGTDHWVFCSSVLNLAELIALRPDLNLAWKGRKIVYFHENQLNYPVRKEKAKEERDFQYGYNQILTALVADKVVFNSEFNRDSMLGRLGEFLNRQPDNSKSHSTSVRSKIEKKSTVLYFPLNIPKPPLDRRLKFTSGKTFLHIVWPHRWEHDKNPEAFFDCLFNLKKNNPELDFRVSVLGESYETVPEVFHKAKEVLSDHILHFGRLEDKSDYFRVLGEADLVVSTAHHEFFGVSTLEAAISGCFPLVPNRLVYPEIFQKPENLYSTERQLYKKLREFCRKPHLPRTKWTWDDARDAYDRFSASALVEGYRSLFISEKDLPS